MLDKLNKQIENLKEKENNLKKEYKEVTKNLEDAKIKEKEMLDENMKIKQMKKKKKKKKIIYVEEVKKIILLMQSLMYLNGKKLLNIQSYSQKIKILKH